MRSLSPSYEEGFCRASLVAQTILSAIPGSLVTRWKIGPGLNKMLPLDRQTGLSGSHYSLHQ